MTANPETLRQICAPWTPDQVAALNAFQQRGGMHPFTCGADHAGPSPVLVAREDGWHCPGTFRETCGYRQDWAHAFMAAPAPAVVSSPPAAWLDGHPQLEAIASAVYERCETGDGGIVHDDPRNIAVAALKGLLAPGDRDGARPGCPDPIECDHEAALGQARETNRRLNYRAQQLESELGTYRRAVRQWDVSERGTYISLGSLRAIGKAAGVDILGSVRHLKHFERVEQAETALTRVERLALTFEVSGNEFIAEQIRAAVGARQPEPENACAHCGSSEHSWDECEAYTALTTEQPDTETQDACTCGSAGDAFVPAGHYRDCPQAARSDVGTEFVRQADQPDHEAMARVEAELEQSGVDTPGCDCGHDGMGVRWHDPACEWRSTPPCDHCGRRGHSFEDCPQAEEPAGGAGGVADETGEGVVPHTMLGAAEIETRPDLNVTPLTGDALNADERIDLNRCPAKHGALGRICELPTGHPGLHTGSGANGGAVWDGDAP